MPLVQVPLSEQLDGDDAQGDDEEVSSESSLTLKDNEKRKKVVRKSHTTKKKLKSIVSKSKSAYTLSIYKAYYPSFILRWQYMK